MGVLEFKQEAALDRPGRVEKRDKPRVFITSRFQGKMLVTPRYPITMG